MPKAEKRVGINDLPDESDKVPDWILNVRDKVGEMSVERFKVLDRN